MFTWFRFKKKLFPPCGLFGRIPVQNQAALADLTFQHPIGTVGVERIFQSGTLCGPGAEMIPQGAVGESDRYVG